MIGGFEKQDDCDTEVTGKGASAMGEYHGKWDPGKQ